MGYQINRSYPMSIDVRDQDDLNESMTEQALESLLNGRFSLANTTGYLVNMGLSFGYGEADAGRDPPIFNGFLPPTMEQLKSEARTYMLETVAGGKRSLMQGVIHIVGRAARFQYENRLAQIAAAKVAA